MTLRSFIDTAKNSDFPIQNLPYGIFSSPNHNRHAGVAIGDYILDLTRLEGTTLVDSDYFSDGTLNKFIAAGNSVWKEFRSKLQELLSDKCNTLAENQSLRDSLLVLQRDVSMQLPVQIGDYTDFYSSKEHAHNVGSLFRDPENAIMENWFHLPVAYHGRASSVVASGTKIMRPMGQVKRSNSDLPTFEISNRLDFEAEVGCIIGKSNQLGQSISIDEAHEYIFGFVLVNDWSARDIQKWEYVPLGPFLGKSLATSISPWIVPLSALEPFRVKGPEQAPAPLAYLQNNEPWAFDINLQSALKTTAMDQAQVISTSNYKHMYWNICQQITHHSSNGCNLQVGDLLASGTISGSTPDSYGSLLELTQGGKQPLQLDDGQTRSFLEDGDSITLKAWADNGEYRIGFGEVTGEILANNGVSK